jgi:hypothetical protein
LYSLDDSVGLVRLIFDPGAAGLTGANYVTRKPCNKSWLNEGPKTTKPGSDITNKVIKGK